MVKAILAIIAAALVAIPTIWTWKVSSEKKKAAKDLEKQKQKIEDAVFSGNANAVADIADSLLRK